jgi:hypothetical protein
MDQCDQPTEDKLDLLGPIYTPQAIVTISEFANTHQRKAMGDVESDWTYRPGPSPGPSVRHRQLLVVFEAALQGIESNINRTCCGGFLPPPEDENMATVFKGQMTIAWFAFVDITLGRCCGW